MKLFHCEVLDVGGKFFPSSFVIIFKPLMLLLQVPEFVKTLFLHNFLKILCYLSNGKGFEHPNFRRHF